MFLSSVNFHFLRSLFFISISVAFIAISTILLPVFSEESSQNFESATPGYWYRFPTDHSEHPEFSTEWWYYTGNLYSPRTQSEYGYQLTFFRIGTKPGKESLYAAHFAVSDINKKEFYHFERINRNILSKAGVKEGFIWNGNWSTDINGDDRHILKASSKDITINLRLHPLTNPVIQGKPGEGISRKGKCESCASHYYSFPLMETVGKLYINGQELEVAGNSWMDHEFGSSQLEKDQVGWDWFSIQFEDKSSLMIYQIRQKDGSPSEFSSGTYVSITGEVKHLTNKDFTLKAKKDWKSPKTNTHYPLEWEVTVPSMDLGLRVMPKMLDQELNTEGSTAVNYWEGAIKVIDRVSGKQIGSGYLELTGYDGSLVGKI